MLLPRQQAKLARGAKAEEHAMSQPVSTTIAVMGIDIGKNSFHVVLRAGQGVSAKRPVSELRLRLNRRERATRRN